MVVVPDSQPKHKPKRKKSKSGDKSSSSKRSRTASVRSDSTSIAASPRRVGPFISLNSGLERQVGHLTVPTTGPHF